MPEASVPMDASFSAWMSWSRRSCSCRASFQIRSAAFPPRISARCGLCWTSCAPSRGSPVTSTIRSARPSAMRASESDVVGMPRYFARRSPGASGLRSAMPTTSTSGLRVKSSRSAVPPLPAPRMITRMVERASSTPIRSVVVLQFQPARYRAGDALQHLVFVCRLYQIIIDAAAQQLSRHLLVWVPCQDNDRHRRVLLLEKSDRLHSVDFGHADVADDDINHQCVVVRADHLDALAPVVGLHNFIPGLGKRQAQDLPDVVFVVHDQDATLARRVLGVQSPWHTFLLSQAMVPAAGRLPVIARVAVASPGRA